MTRAWLVSAMLLASGVANAGPSSRPMAAPPPDGPGVFTRLAPADNRRIIGILDVRVEGFPDDVKDDFRRQLEDQFDTKRYWIEPRARMKQLLISSTKWTEGCVVGDCLVEVRARTGAELVLLAALTGAGTSFGYVITLVRTDTGHVLQQVSEHCDVCTVSEAMSNATLATVGLLNNVPDSLPDEQAQKTMAIHVATSAIQRELEARDRHTTRLGITLTVVGLATAVVGAVIYQLDSKSSFAAPVAAGGGALALGGVVVLTF